MVLYSGLQCSLLKVLIVVSELQLFILITNAQPPDFVYHCPNSTTYNQNTTYHANLRRLLSDLSSNNAATKMFLNATAGNDSPDVIYGLVLCSGDITIDECRQCLRLAATEIVQRCLVEKESYIWYDKCMLRYNNISFFGSLATSPNFHFWEMNKVLNQDRFNQVLEEAMDEVIIRAAGIGNVGPLKGFATGEANFNGLLKLYNLVQCTPDLSGSDCNFCLRYALSQRPDGSQSGRFMCPSCRIRYELYQFYSNDTTVASPDQPPDDIVAGGSGGPKTAVIIVIVVLISFSIIMSTMCFYFLRKKAREKKNIMMEDTEADSLQYDIRFIKDATNNFSADNKIGEGGFGEVFKGSLDNGQQIAVKRLSKSTGEGDQEFKNEVTIVAKLQHINLVLLLGYCLDTEEKILIFEFVPNKSLDFMLFDQGKETPLDWSSRYKIIGGVARGILYLHEDSRLRIIHRDIKASNVLLDNDLNAKISDFGLARIVGIDKSEGNTNRVVGTFGYMSPEYIMQGQFSVKSDVFSFGVLVLEIISGQRNNKFYRISDHLLSHAWNLWKDGKPLDLLDPTLGDSFDKYEVTRCTHIGLLCVQKDVDERLTMASVILMLNSSSMTLPMPHQPAFFMKDDIIPVSDLVESDLPSANGVSVSEMYAR